MVRHPGDGASATEHSAGGPGCRVHSILCVHINRRNLSSSAIFLTFEIMGRTLSF